MTTGRVLWIIWCLAWCGLWTVVSVLAWTGVAAAWQLVLFPALALGSGGAIGVPVGVPRDPAKQPRDPAN